MSPRILVVGHGMGSTRQQEDAELADKLAFLLRQFGLSGA